MGGDISRRACLSATTALILFPGTAYSFGRPMDRASFLLNAFPLDKAIDIPSGVTSINTRSWARQDIGAAIYRLVARESLADRTLQRLTVIRASDGRLFELTGDRLDPAMAGAIGDGLADDSDALDAVLRLCPAAGTVDLAQRIYRVRRGLRPGQPKVLVTNGTLRLDPSSDDTFYALTATDNACFQGIEFHGPDLVGTKAKPRYIGGICSGNVSYPPPMNVTPANGVLIRNCRFTQLTAGIFVGGASTQTVPSGWTVTHCLFDEIVGFPGQSEGYGLLFSPASDSIASDNRFRKIRRHAIYLAGGACQNKILKNSIFECDNIAIQSNTAQNQPLAKGNIISGNSINIVSASVDYGYISAIGIGLYGRFADYQVAGNHISGALHCGIHLSPDTMDLRCGDNVDISDNVIDMPVVTRDSALRLDNVRSGVVRGNEIRLRGKGYGVVIVGGGLSSCGTLVVSGNIIDLGNAQATPFRLVMEMQTKINIVDNHLTGVAPRSGPVYRTGRWATAVSTR